MTSNHELAKEFAEGKVLLIDKPLHWTSFDAVNKIKSLLKHRLGLKKIKVGHAGTLDPLASGLLIICTGKMTRSIDAFQAREKEYTGTFYIGATTPSSDLETQPDQVYPTDHINEDTVHAAAQKFQGKILQIPPLFSAKKIEGKRAYEHARAGDQLQLKANVIEIKSFDIVRWELPEADFNVVCGKGTYIRALARDFGEQLGSGAYLKALRRTRIGEFSVEQALSPEQLSQIINEAASTATTE
ncbi:MAG: tRNA pseudouridine(55) synthase TruB [Bacteroidota bacterium]